MSSAACNLEQLNSLAYFAQANLSFCPSMAGNASVAYFRVVYAAKAGFN